MNEVDKLMVEQITTRPWVELSLLGVQVEPAPSSVSMRLTLTWIELGEEQEGYSEIVGTKLSAEDFRLILGEVHAFARGAIPVCWHAAPVKKAIIDMTKHVDMDRSLCFLLRPQSRWLDPRVWCRTRTGKYHSMEQIAKSVGYPKHSPPRSIDPAVLAYKLVHREGFPIRKDWTASELAHWQEDARAAHLREEMPGPTSQET